MGKWLACDKIVIIVTLCTSYKESGMIYDRITETLYGISTSISVLQGNFATCTITRHVVQTCTSFKDDGVYLNFQVVI